jgi:hypothetical protein
VSIVGFLVVALLGAGTLRAEDLTNTAFGAGALPNGGNLGSGGDNSAFGFETLNSNSTGSSNTATGFGALLENTSGDENTATGFDALLANTTGSDNTAEKQHHGRG